MEKDTNTRRDAAPEPKPGLAARVAALFKRAVAPEPQAASEADAASEPDAAPEAAAEPAPQPAAPTEPVVRLTPLPVLNGQASGVAYALATEGLPLPPGGVAYLVETPAAAPGAEQVPDAAALADGIVAYLDTFGRAFSCGSVQVMPPARVPDVRFAPYDDPAGHAGRSGCVEVAVSKTKSARLAEYVETDDGRRRIVGTRADFGFGDGGLTPVEACACAFLALWLFPRKAGVELSATSVKDVLGRLRTTNLFEALDAVVAGARRDASHPLFAPPGVLEYFAATMSAAGLEGLKSSDLVADADAGSVPGDGGAAEGGTVSLAGVVAAGGTLPEGVTTIHATIPSGGDVMASIRQALAGAGITGLTFLGGFGADGEKVALPPTVRLARTSAYANVFYAAFDRSKVSATGARKLLEAESLLNRLVFSVEDLDRAGAVQSSTFAQAAEADRRAIEGIGALAAPYADGAAGGIEPADTGSADLDARFAFARGCESLRLPFRMEYGFRFNVASGDLVVDVDLPSSGVMPRLRADGRPTSYAEREGLATRYALRLAVVLAAVGLWAGPCVARVTVNCWQGKGSMWWGVDELAPLDDGGVRGPATRGPDCVASLRVGRAWFGEHFSDAAHRALLADDPLAFAAQLGDDCALCLDGDGHLCRVAPLFDIDSPRLHPVDGAIRPDLDDRMVGAHGRERLGVSVVSDLAIYENARRRAMADAIADALEEGGREAGLAAVKDAHDRTENLLVRGVCLQVEDGIRSGELGAQSRHEIARLFSDVYGLQAGTLQMYRAQRTDPEQACRQLAAMLADADGRALFADTDTRRFRYFDSYASRVIYGLHCPEANDGRELRLCPDEYFLCHYRLAAVLAESLDHAEDAIAHARRCVELAPSVASSYLRLARCYFSVFDYLSEIDTLRDMLRIAWNPENVGLALYWLGYAFCLVDKPEVGLACYQSCIEFDSDLTEAAATEATNFMQRAGGLPKSYPQGRIDELLASEGIDLAQVSRNVGDLVRAAGAATEVGSFGLAHKLLEAAEPGLGDDVLPPILESLEE